MFAGGRLTRREVAAGGLLLLAGCMASRVTQVRTPFVRREGSRLLSGTEPYRFTGTNMWYAAYLGADAPYGDRSRLGRELDRLAALGVSNIRILGSSELSPLKNSVTPAFRTQSSEYSETLLRGLDIALAEMGGRGMRAVIYLTNFWEWSGGMMTYLYWTNGGRYINMNDPAHPWPEFPDMVSQFYSSAPAIRLYHDYVRAVVGRTNSVTGKRYVDDPTIMSWQLANEPRPGGSDAVGLRQMPAYLAWIGATAKLIKSLDANHLVSTGSEGTQGCIGRDDCVLQAHAFPEVDYLTAHIWPQNWSWADPKDLAGTWSTVRLACGSSGPACWPHMRAKRSVMRRAMMSGEAPAGNGDDIVSLEALERRHIEAVLHRTNWHQGRAATLLGISSKTLYRKIREFGFQRPRNGHGGA